MKFKIMKLQVLAVQALSMVYRTVLINLIFLESTGQRSHKSEDRPLEDPF